MNQAPLAWVEISRSALLGNARLFKNLIGPDRRLMAVVKSNAYGHGLVSVSRIIQSTVDWFGVVNLDEALELRRQGIRKPILCLSYYQPAQIFGAAEHQIDLAVGSFEQLTSVIRSARYFKRRLKIHVKCDVGTSRIGFLPADIPSVTKIALTHPNLKLRGLFAHLADSENQNQAFTKKQNDQFDKLCQASEATVGTALIKHIACTAAALVNPKTRRDLVRVGLGLYGLWPSQSARLMSAPKISQSLGPALSWKTQLISRKRLPAGSTIGYGRTRRLAQPANIGVIPVGYFEGYPRWLSNRGRVLIRNQSAPVIGRICMNMTMLDLSGIPKAAVGDEVVLIGRQGRGEVTADELAKRCQTINYEIVTRINQDLPRLITD